MEFRQCLNEDGRWNITPFMAGNGGSACSVDSTEFVQGKYPLIFRSIEMFPASRSYYRFSARLSQQLFIPGNYQQLEFTLNSKCLSVNRGWLKVVALIK